MHAADARGEADEGTPGLRPSDARTQAGFLGRPSTAACVQLYHHACLPITRLAGLAPAIDTVFFNFVDSYKSSGMGIEGRGEGAREGGRWIPQPGLGTSRVDLLGPALRFDIDACDFDRTDLCPCASDRTAVCERCWPLVRRSAHVVAGYVQLLGLGRVDWFFSGGRGVHGFAWDSIKLTSRMREALVRGIKKAGGVLDEACTTSVRHKIRAPWSCHQSGHVNIFLRAPPMEWELGAIREASDVRRILGDLALLKANLDEFRDVHRGADREG